MERKIGYYRFLAPAFLAKQGLPITKENISLEAKRLMEIEINKSLIKTKLSFSSDVKQVFIDQPITNVSNGELLEIKYTIGKSSTQTIKCVVKDNNGVVLLANVDNESEGIRLVGDDMNDIKFYMYLNLNNSAVAFVETSGNYYNMPIVDILSIEKI